MSSDVQKISMVKNLKVAYYVKVKPLIISGIIVLANLEVRPTSDSSRKFCFELVSRESRDKLPQVIKATKATDGGTHVKGKHSRL